MATSTKCLAGIAVVVLLLTSCKANKIRPELLERGNEWMSWNTAERNRYVLGYVDSYLTARHTACVAADTLFEVGQTHRMGDEQHPTEFPSGRCLASVDDYSRF
jgi:hypothetical protein